MNKKASLKHIFARNSVYFVLLFLVILFSCLSPSFATVNNLFNILRQVAIIGICSVGMTMVIITGGIDISIGSIIGVADCLAAVLMVAGVHPVLACAIVLAAGTLIGAFNAFLVTAVGLPPLIATLGMQTALRGVAYLLTKGLPIYGFPPGFSVIGQGYVGVVPIPVVIMVVFFAVGYFLLEKTKYGRYIYGIGSNEEASRLSGLNVRGIKYSAYCISGFTAALAGLILLSRINSGQPNAGSEYEMNVITSVVLGGVSIAGGEGKVTSVIVGVLIMGVLLNGMVMCNLQEYYQWIVKGGVLLLAVSYDKIINRKKEKVTLA